MDGAVQYPDACVTLIQRITRGYLTRKKLEEAKRIFDDITKEIEEEYTQPGHQKDRELKIMFFTSANSKTKRQNSSKLVNDNKKYLTKHTLAHRSSHSIGKSKKGFNTEFLAKWPRSSIRNSCNSSSLDNKQNVIISSCEQVAEPRDRLKPVSDLQETEWCLSSKNRTNVYKESSAQTEEDHMQISKQTADTATYTELSSHSLPNSEFEQTTSLHDSNGTKTATVPEFGTSSGKLASSQNSDNVSSHVISTNQEHPILTSSTQERIKADDETLDVQKQNVLPEEVSGEGETGKHVEHEKVTAVENPERATKLIQRTAITGQQILEVEKAQPSCSSIQESKSEFPASLDETSIWNESDLKSEDPNTLREKISLELTWIEQAIASRKQYLSLVEKLRVNVP